MARARRLCKEVHGVAPVLPTRVPELLRSLARWAVASSMGVLPACAAHSEPKQDRADEPVWQPIGCENGQFPNLLERVQLKDAPDYVGVYRQYHTDQPTADDPGSYPLVELGMPCTGTDEVAACNAEVSKQMMISKDCVAGTPCPPFLLITNADLVTRADDRGALLALLGGTIDDPNEAALLAMFDGYQTACPTKAIGDGTMLRGTDVSATEEGFEVRSEWDACANGLFRQTLRVTEAGVVSELEKTLLGKPLCASGRRPTGLCALPDAERRVSLPVFLARVGRLEAASVYAFERLARELRALRAPNALIASALRSARDEVRHTYAINALAHRFGAEPLVPVIADLPERSPAQIALENAVEGCVRETYGAVLAHHQAAAAHDPKVRAVMRVIADDETRHAQLAWQIAQWLEPQLPVEVQRTLASARAAAFAQLFTEIDPGLSPNEAQAIGWPAREGERAMLQRLGAALQLG